jgi:hypothetical protein
MAGPYPEKCKLVSASIVRPSGSCLRICVSAIASKTKKTHKRGRVTFVYSEPEFKDEVIEVLFDGRESPVDVLVDSVRKVSTKQS